MNMQCLKITNKFLYVLWSMFTKLLDYQVFIDYRATMMPNAIGLTLNFSTNQNKDKLII